MRYNVKVDSDVRCNKTLTVMLAQNMNSSGKNQPREGCDDLIPS